MTNRACDISGTRLQSLTIGERDGARSFINVDVPHDLDAVTAGWVMGGFQQMTRVGQRVSLGIELCGAAGRVIGLRSIKAAR